MSIAKLAGLLLPDFAVTGSLASECVGNFVKQHLMD